LIILPGGAIRASHLGELISKTGAEEVHTSAIIETANTPSAKEIEKMKIILNR
jgi:copper homeostasis protein CutC